MSDLHPRTVEELRRHFDFFDDDRNGFIDFAEYQDMLKIIGYEVEKEEAIKSFLSIDSDGDGQISLQEFMVWWNEMWDDD